MKNPFKYSGCVFKKNSQSEAVFVERLKIVRTIDKLLQQGEYVQVVGPHQSGRTTLAMNLIDKWIPEDSSRQNIIPMLISCEPLIDATPERFIQMMLGRFHRVFNEGIPDKKGKKIKSILENNYPETFLDLYSLLVKIGNELKKAKQYSHFIFLVDEIEAMPDDLVIDVLRFFRNLFSHYADRRWDSPYRVITFTTRDLSHWKLKRSSPYNISNVVKLEPFDREEFDTMLDKDHVGKMLPNMIFDESAKKRIMIESGGYPYFIQRLCHILVEKHSQDDKEAVSVDSKEVFEAVLKIFGTGDSNLQNIYQEMPLKSNAWQLCKRLVSGHKELYAANDQAIMKLVELGIVTDRKRYCHLSNRLYKRQILKRTFDQEYQTRLESFPDDKLLLLNISCLQEILLHAEIRRLIFVKMEQGMPKESDKISADLLAYLDGILKGIDPDLKDKGPSLDMEEVDAYINYYDLESVDREQLLSLLINVFSLSRNTDSPVFPFPM